MNRIDVEYRKQLQLRYGIIGDSPVIQEAINILEKVAPTDLPVLINGETGTGKEVFANALHSLSMRKSKPYVSVNCAAIPDSLLEAELFGHEKGAFTSAIEQRVGFFEAANKGTIFLDEIGEMPLITQVKLLRILESGEYSRLGSSIINRVDVRVIAATNRNLEEEVRLKNFRQDLYYRLNSVNIILPPLRDHLEDIPLYVSYFANKICDKNHSTYDKNSSTYDKNSSTYDRNSSTYDRNSSTYDKNNSSNKNNSKFKGISAGALKILQSMPWSGNIRELKNFIDKIVTLEYGGYIDEITIKKYLPQVLSKFSLAQSNATTAIIPAVKQANQANQEVMGSDALILRTLLELKQDTSDIKRGLGKIGSAIEELVDDVSALKDAAIVNYSENIDIANGLTLAEMEKRMILSVLSDYDGNRRRASQALGISERTLHRKLKEYGVAEI